MFKNGMIPVYYDAEFTGLHRNTTPISIALTTDIPSVYFYAEFNDYDESQINDWLRDNVIANLPYNNLNSVTLKNVIILDSENNLHNVKMKGSRQDVAAALQVWLQSLVLVRGGDKVQFYTDCYAYDWLIMNDLLCADGNALNLPEYASYIPMDLSTALQLNGIDPDITREEFAGSKAVSDLKNTEPFSRWGEDMKHNCLWDASICKICFDNLTSTV